MLCWFTSSGFTNEIDVSDARGHAISWRATSSIATIEGDERDWREPHGGIGA
jgi:hypothetical protein